MKAKAISIYLAGALTAGIPSAALLASAAQGDAIYEAPAPMTCITAEQAVCYADCAIASGSWAGSRVDMIKASAGRNDTCETGFSAVTQGLMTAPLVNVPVGSVVHGVAVE